MAKPNAYDWHGMLRELTTEHSLGWIAQESGLSRRTITRLWHKQHMPTLSTFEAIAALHYRVCEKAA